MSSNDTPTIWPLLEAKAALKAAKAALKVALKP